ncbi:MAG: preprotein translocase subunit SecE [bacterium]
MKITQYFKDTRAEMAHVTWPSRQQAISFAVLVILISVGTAAFLGLSDFIFSRLLSLFV